MEKGFAMDPEEERVLYLSRAGRDKIFKYGTYNMVTERAITQDHPFYEMRDVAPVKVSYVSAAQQQMQMQEQMQMQQQAAPEVPAEPEPELDADALAAQVISSNFKVGLSQEEVDALLNGMP